MRTRIKNRTFMMARKRIDLRTKNKDEDEEKN